MSKTTSLYRHFNSDGDLLYVGISIDVLSRQSAHINSSPWSDEISKITIERFQTKYEALLAEYHAIAYENPRHNTSIRKPKAPKSLTDKHQIDIDIIF